MVPFRTALFDKTFDVFITKRVTSVLWSIYIVLIFVISGIFSIAAIVGIIYAVTSEQVVLAVLIFLGSLVLIPIWTFLTLILIRIGMESSVALIAIAENTARGQNLNSVSTPISGMVAPANKSSAIQVSKDDMLADFDENPFEWAREILGSKDFQKWLNAGKPDLKPWISGGLKEFSKWLAGR